MMKKIQVEITEAHIEQAYKEFTRCNLSDCCPTHQALRPLIKGKFKIGWAQIFTESDDHSIKCYPIGWGSQELQHQIYEFTFRNNFVPGTYEIEVEEKYLI